MTTALQARTKLVHESMPRPSNRRELIALIEKILGLGMVQSLRIEVGQDIKFSRKVPIGEEGEDYGGEENPSLLNNDLADAARNAEMVVLEVPPSVEQLRTLYLGFSLVAMRRCLPKAILVNQRKLLNEWLEIKEDLQELFGVEVFESKQLPEDTLLLLGVKADDTEMIVLSVKILMDRPKKEKSNATK